MQKHILLYEQFLDQEPVNEGFKELLVSTAISIGLLVASPEVKGQSDISKLDGPEYCKSVYTDSVLQKAKDYWKNWLESPATLEKIAKNYKTTAEDIKSNYVPKWLEIIEPLKIVYKNMARWDIAAVDTSASKKEVYVNPKSIVFKPNFRAKYEEDPIRTLVHELQHKMSSLIPINPAEVVTAALGQRTDPRTGKYHIAFGDDVLKRIGEDLGVDMEKHKRRAYYYWDAFRYSKSVNTYAKSPTEMVSRINALKYKYGIKPEDQHGLKPEMFRQTFLKEKVDADMDWILVAWAGYGFPPFQEFLDRLGSLAANSKNKTQTDQA